jgi:NAD(P)-dependent dehydrogenase (short-subunit alcohol dehydrogenase family)
MMMSPSKIIVITGSTRGIGFGLADAFLARGCSVVISGRGSQASADAVNNLGTKYDSQRVFGLACDVTVPDQVQALWDRSQAKFGRIDIWINNAGQSGEQQMIWEQTSAELAAVIETNVLGTTYGTQVALKGMLAQGSGAIYNLEGMGSDGRKLAGLTMYGTSKYAIHYFTESLAVELKEKPVIIGSLRPGMVMTDMILDRYIDRPEEFERAKKIFNIIADRVENVAPWLADKVLENQKSGVVISYTSSLKMMWRFASNPFIKRSIIK